MKKALLLMMGIWSGILTLNAQIVINEILPGGTVELKNLGSTSVDISDYWLCDFPSYQRIGSSNIICGNTNLEPGEILAVDNFNTISSDDGEMGLYTSNNFGNSNDIIDYVEWGSTDHQRSNVAIAAGIWNEGDFVAAFASNESLAYNGDGDTSSDWTASAATTICAENGGSCEAEGGVLTTSDGMTALTICALDGESDAFDVELSGNEGTNSAWVITDDQGNILALPPSPPFDLDGAGEGVCLVWHLSFEDDLEGAEIGANANDLTGCFDLSNPITVTRIITEGLDGGNLTTDDGATVLTICALDGESDAFDVELTDEEGANTAWVITDDQGNILALPPGPPFDLDGAGEGICLVWHLSFEDGLQGAEVGMNANDLQGCFDLSNPITVTRIITDGLEGGNLLTDTEETELTICAGDGVSDAFDVLLSDAEGPNSAWVITDDQGNILGLPPGPPFDLEGAGSGVCLVWHLSFEDGLVGAEVGMNANDLQGCFDLSNPITVIRNGVNGGDLSTDNGTTELTICALDGESDAFDINLSGNEGANAAWVITDDQGNILALPPGPPFDLDGAGEGVCLVWHLSFEDGLTGAEVGLNANDLDGCFDLSNPITVTRIITNGLDGGTLEGGPFEFCVGDGIEDNVSGITLTGNSGANTQWVITDDQGNILGLPPMPGVVNFDGAGPGVCLIWHLSFEDGLVGLEAGLNANDLQGCFDLSNPIEVIRNQPEGGTLEGGPFEFCVGDGIEDNVSGITLTGNSGANSQWVITDDQGNILGLPPMPGVVNFDGAGPGVCLIWHLSFEDGLVGLEAGLNANDLQGCFDLSNPIEVIRNQPEGGTLEGGPFEFCVGDGIEDNVSGITLTGNSGANSQWVITDDQGNILGLPPMPGVVNFDGAGPGVCLIWHLSFEDGLVGLEAGLNANDLQGCFDLSNPIEVIRNQPDGGTLEGGPFEFCVGDGIEDNVSGITLTGNSGANSQWVITDDQGNILGLPPMPGVVNFDGAGPGVCLIWHLSFEDGLVGLEAGLNANDLQGCFDLSNPIEVIRLSGNDCTGGDGVDVALSIEVDDTTYEQYENVTYTIMASNTGSETASNLVISAGLPNGLVYTSHSTSSGDYSLFFEEWTIEELAPGESVTLELVLFTLVNNVDINNFVEVVEQDQPDVDSTPNNGNGNTPQEDDEAAVTITPADPDPMGGTDADLSLSIDVDFNNVEQYENVTYTITLHNDGPDAASNVVVSAGLPDGMVYTSHNTTNGDYDLFFEEWSIDILESGESAVLELVLFTLVEDTDINNFVEVIASDQNDPDSTPDNGNGSSPQEDDEAAINITVLEDFTGSGSSQSFTLSQSNIEIVDVDLFPVPANNNLNVVLQFPQDEIIDQQITDLNGRVLQYQQVEVVTGKNTLELNISDLPDGMYLLNIRYANSKVINRQFQKVSR